MIRASGAVYARRAKARSAPSPSQSAYRAQGEIRMNAIWRQRIVPGVSAVALALSTGLAIAAGNDKEEGGVFHARLTGFQEVPSVSTAARGEFKGKLDPRTGVIDYEFSYEGLQ